MLGGLYDRIAAESDGLRLLAAARLRRRVLVILHKALERSGMNQSDLARRLRRRRSAVNQIFRGDGNVRIETLADYLYEMGFELEVSLVHAGEPRRAFQGRRRINSVTTGTAQINPIAWEAPPPLRRVACSQTSNPIVPTRLAVS